MAPISLQTVLICESVDTRCRAILEENGIAITEKLGMTKEELIAEIKNFEGLIVRSATKVTADVINAADKLKIIGRAGTGVDNVDVEAATKRGVIVMNTPGGNTISAAELTCALLMSLSRNLPQAVISMKEGKWDRKKFMGSELCGKVLGIVGLGKIGKEVATRMQSFNMRTIGYDPITPPEVSSSWGVEPMSLEQLWPQCDYITVHTPLIPATVGLLNDETFAKCKKGVKVVNCARGGIIDESALLRALESGQCGGAGLDVFVEEPPKNRSLVDHPNVICCPHLGASTKEAQARCGEELALQMVDMVKGRNLIGAVNAQVLASTFFEGSHQLMQLGEALGALLQSCSDSTKPFNHVQITIQGENMKASTGYMKSAVLVGMLKRVSDCPPNLVNVLSLSKEKGIEVCETHNPSDTEKAAVCKVEAEAGGCSFRVCGSVQGGAPVLLELNGSAFKQPISLTGNLLLFKASGGPQLLAALAGKLAEQAVEIESFSATVGPTKDLWYCVGVSSHLRELDNIKSLFKDVAQLQI